MIWLDFFAGGDQHRLNCVRSVVSLHVSTTQRLALVRVGSIHAAVAQAGFAAAVVEDPCDDLPPGTNAAHALIGPIGALNNTVVRAAIASSVRASDIVPYKLDP